MRAGDSDILFAPVNESRDKRDFNQMVAQISRTNSLIGFSVLALRLMKQASHAFDFENRSFNSPRVAKAVVFFMAQGHSEPSGLITRDRMPAMQPPAEA